MGTEGNHDPAQSPDATCPGCGRTHAPAHPEVIDADAHCANCGDKIDPNADPADDVPWVLDPFVEYFHKPVALQVKHPVVLVDNFGATVKVPQHDGETATLGVPQIPSDGQSLSASPVLAGVLAPSECMGRLVLRMRGGTGAVIEVTIMPDDVQHVFVIVEPGQPSKREQSLILTPKLGGDN